MLLKENFTESHIRDLQRTNKRDPILLERAVYAFGLLEALVRVGLPFIFKGGTCLILLLEKPRRLSTDIDIVVEPGTDIKDYLDKAAAIFPFSRGEEQKRTGKNNIEKRHFKFTYNSPIKGEPLYILLDVLFEENHYSEIVEKEIQNELLITDAEYLKVKIPSPDCILADKLTAFAPHTTGILLGEGKDMEVMKQLYDIMSLLEVISDVTAVKETYNIISAAEAHYRGIAQSPDECLWDSFNAALCIAARGKITPDEYKLYVKGIHDLRSHIYAENYTPEIAAIRAVKIMYFILCLISDCKFEPLQSSEEYKEYISLAITSKQLVPLKYLKKVAPNAYAYAIKADKLLNEMEI